MSTLSFAIHMNSTTTPTPTNYVRDLAGIYFKVFGAIGVVIAVTLACVCIRRRKCQKRKSDKKRSEDARLNPPESPTQETSNITDLDPVFHQEALETPVLERHYFQPRSTANTNHYDKIDETAVTDMPIASCSDSSYLHPCTSSDTKNKVDPTAKRAQRIFTRITSEV